jgi:hypothetical protein
MKHTTRKDTSWRFATMRWIIAGWALTYAHADETVIARAEKAMAEGKFGEARAVLQRASETGPDDAYILYNIGLTHYAEGDHARAQEFFTQAELLTPDPGLRARVFVQLGNIQAHAGAAALDSESSLAIEHWRRAHQLYDAALRQQPGQDIAEANRRPVRDGLVTLLQSRSERYAAEAERARQISQRIELLMLAHGDLEEALALNPDNKRSKTLHKHTQDQLETTLVKQGDVWIDSAKESLRDAQTQSDIKLRTRLLEHTALTHANHAINAYQDALLLHPTAEPIEAKRQQAKRLVSEILTELGATQLMEAENEIARRRLVLTESAVDNLQEALQANPANERAEVLLDQALTWLAKHYEEEADHAVADAEQRDAPATQTNKRQEANDLYEEAMALKPDDQELKEKAADNALELAELLNETGTDKLEEGIALTPTEPEKAVATLERAVSDFNAAAQLLQDHGLDAAEAMTGAEAAQQQIGDLAQEAADGQAAQEAAQEAGLEAGQEAAGQAEQKEPGSPSEDSAKPSAEAGASPAQLMAQLNASNEKAQAALQEARAQAPPAPSSTEGAEKSGTPSYESVAFVAEGGDFDNKSEGSGGEREGNFNTEAMKKPARDW